MEIFRCRFLIFDPVKKTYVEGEMGIIKIRKMKLRGRYNKVPLRR